MQTNKTNKQYVCKQTISPYSCNTQHSDTFETTALTVIGRLSAEHKYAHCYFTTARTTTPKSSGTCHHIEQYFQMNEKSQND